MSSKKEAIMGKAAKKRPSAVVFELEYVGTTGRQVVFDALRGVLDKKGIELTPAQFARLGPDRQPGDFVSALLRSMGRERLLDEKVLAEVNEAVAAGFSKPSLKVAPGLKKLLAAAAEQGMTVGCVSILDRGPMQELATALGFAESNVALFSNFSGKMAVPGVDAWLKIAKLAAAPATRCLAVASSNVSCRSSLRAHMHCVSVPDRFTESSDFGGTDFFVQTLEDLDTAAAFAILETGQ